MRVNEVYEGDCLDIMKGLPDNCIDTIVTDPPYGLEFMGKDWDHGIPGIAYWAEALRIAKPGAYLMAFGGTRTYHRLACAIEDAGWEIRDCVTYLNDGSQAEAAFMASLNDEQLAAYLELHYPNEQIAWVYGSGMGLGYDVSKGIDKSKGAEREVKRIEYKSNELYRSNGQNTRPWMEKALTNGYHELAGDAPATPLAAKFSGFRSRLKPAFEPIVVAMKPIDGTYATNAERWGLAGLDIDGCRVPTLVEGHRTNGKDNSVYGDLSYTAGQHWEGSNLGRYPANIIHDGSDQIEAEFAKAGVSKDGVAVRENKGVTPSIFLSKDDRLPKPNMGYGGEGTPSRFFATCPPDLPRFIYQAKASPAERGGANNHPTVKPLSLIRELVKLTRPPDGGVVLDPFAGSGTTGLACLAENRDYILIEKESDYCEIIRRRIAEYTGEEIAPKEVEVKGETVKQMPLW